MLCEVGNKKKKADERKNIFSHNCVAEHINRDAYLSNARLDQMSLLSLWYSGKNINTCFGVSTELLLGLSILVSL